MGDQVTIPRTYAGAIGAADVTNAIKRKYISAHVTATGNTFGNSTTAFQFQRPQVLEKVTLMVNKSGTTTGAVSVMKNGSTAATSRYGTTSGWHQIEITPTISDFLTSDNFYLVTTATAAAIDVVIEFREGVA